MLHIYHLMLLKLLTLFVNGSYFLCCKTYNLLIMERGEKTVKKVVSFVTVFIMAFSLISSVKINAQEVSVSVPSAILIEKNTGMVIYEKNADEAMKPASVTKIMTILLIMESIKDGQFGYDDIVTASAYATSMGGSQVYLKEGEQMSVDEMLKCIIVASANDACVAMAEFVSGSVEAFVSQMNEKAKDLGMKNTNFVNCTGLEAQGHLTTARDISIMSRELLGYDDVKKYTTVWMDSIRNGEFGLTNTNKLIRFYDGATGLKTGYTSQSKYCISATAQKNGMELIAVVMAAESSDQRNADAKALLNYGFARYKYYKPTDIKLEPVKIIKGKKESVTPVLKEDFGALIEKDSEKNIECKINLCADVHAPVEKTQKLGEAVLFCDGKEISKTDIICPERVEKKSFADIFLELLNYFLII